MKHLSRLLPLIGLVLFVWIIQRVGTDQIMTSLRAMDLRVLWLVVPFVVLTILIKAYKWHLILRATDIRYPLSTCIKVWCIGFFAGLVTPSKIGDAVRAYYLKRDTKHTATEGLSSVFIDRIFDILGLLTFTAISILMLVFWFHEQFSIGGVMIGIAAIVIGIALSFQEKLVRWMLRPLFYLLVPARLQDSFRDVFERFYGSIRRMKERKRLLLASFIMNLLGWLMFIAYAYALARAQHLALSFTHLLIIVPLVSIVELLPVSVSGMGTREVTLVGLFALFQVPPEAAVPFSLVYLVLGGLVLGIPGLLWWLREPLQFSSLSRSRSDGAG